jgi:hypothetical protein
MLRRKKIAVGVVIVALLLIGIWLALPGPRGPSGISVGFTTVRGHFPEPGILYADQIIVLWVTNTGNSTVTLNNPFTQFENPDGRLIMDMNTSWNQKGFSVTLSPGSSASLATGFESDRRKLKFAFDYHRDAGPVRRAISKALGWLPLKRLPMRTQNWLHRNGMVDGAMHGHYEGAWVTNQMVHGIGSNSSAPDTNRVDRHQ